ncbi:L,D-transpeptidase [Candidatus Peregrinibacteria bacterium]|nr:L,D-transpeptidase [Candidatus Peregrinibacteria bacterium]
MRKKKHQALKALIIIGIAIAIAFGGVAISIILSRVSNEIQASVIKSTKVSRKKITRRSSAGRLLAQLMIPPEILNPLEACTYLPPEKPDYQAEIIEPETDVWSIRKGDFEVTLYAKNTGNVAWFGDLSGCPNTNYVRLGTARDRDHDSVFFNPGDPRWVNANRIKMNEMRVDPGEIASFSFYAFAPDVNDIFREYFQPVLDGKSWIEGRKTFAQLDVYVGSISEEREKALFYLGKSGQAAGIDTSAPQTVEVDLSEQKTYVKLGDAIIREYPVSTGAAKTPTPKGNFKILLKQELRIGSAAPHYRMPFFQMFTEQGAGFHALPYLANDKGVFWNEALNHIGMRVSHGCVRLLDEDAEDLYKLTAMGAGVYVHD